VGDNFVSFSIDNFNYTSYGSEFFSLSDASLIDLVKSKFPKQYEDFLKGRSGNEFPFSIKREIPIVMDLTFRHKELIEKKIGKPEWMWYDRLNKNRLAYMTSLPFGIPMD